MTLTTAQIIEAASAIEEIMGDSLPVALSFTLCQNYMKLDEKRKAALMTVQTIPRRDGKPEDGPFEELLSTPVDIDIEPIGQKALMNSVTTITPRCLLSLMPLFKEGD